jgi:hypothetical protein
MGGGYDHTHNVWKFHNETHYFVQLIFTILLTKRLKNL